MEYSGWLFFPWVLGSNSDLPVCARWAIALAWAFFSQCVFIPHPFINCVVWDYPYHSSMTFFSKITKNSHLAKLVVTCGLSFSLFHYHNFKINILHIISYMLVFCESMDLL